MPRLNTNGELPDDEQVFQEQGFNRSFDDSIMRLRAVVFKEMNALKEEIGKLRKPTSNHNTHYENGVNSGQISLLVNTDQPPKLVNLDLLEMVADDCQEKQNPIYSVPQYESERSATISPPLRESGSLAYSLVASSKSSACRAHKSVEDCTAVASSALAGSHANKSVDKQVEICFVDEREDIALQKLRQVVNPVSPCSSKSPGRHSNTTVNYQCYPLWMHDEDEDDRKSSEMVDTYLFTSQTMTNTRTDATSADPESYFSFLIFSPTARLPVAWDFMLLLVIIYDCVMIPLDLLEPPRVIGIIILSWVALLFWTLTIPLSFMTGFVSESGRIEMNPKKIAWRYLKTWFPFDFTIVAIDWVEILYKDQELLSFITMSRSLRILRVARIFRVFKLPTLLDRIVGYNLKSQNLTVVLKIAFFTCLLFLITHIVACLWYSIGTSESDSWITRNDLPDVGFGIRYSYSLHWALTQFIGSEVVSPTNSKERLFAVVLLLFAYVASAGFVSGITASWTQISIVASREKKQFAMLTRYLEQNTISADLAMRVRQAAQHAMARQQKNMPEEEVELLAMVTSHLRSEIHYEVYSPIMVHHSFFRFYCEKNKDAAQKVCHVACKTLLFASSDILFSEGERSPDPSMLFLTTGRLDYIKRAEKPITVSDGWLCEAALWCYWKHLGLCRASDHTTVLALSANKFQNVAVNFQGDVFWPAVYAQAFVEHLNYQENVIMVALDDLTCGKFDSAKLVSQWAKSSKRKDIWWFLNKSGSTIDGMSRTSRFSQRSTH